VFSGVVEEFERIDDDLSVPLGSGVVMTALRLL